MHISIATILVAALAQSDERELRFHPAEPARISKFVRSGLKLELVAATTTQDGQPVVDAGLAEPGTTLTVEQTAVVVDEFTLVADGFPYSFRRKYDHLVLTAGVLGSDPYRVEGVLQGRTVRFEWAEEEKAWDTRLVGENRLPQELLEDLSVDRDFLWLLPAEFSPPKGKTWLVANEDLLAALAPDGYSSFGDGDQRPSTESWLGGSLPIVPPLPRSTRFWTEAAEGRVLAEYKGRRDHNGDEVAVVTVTFDLRGSRDPLELANETIAMARSSDPREQEILELWFEMLNYGGEGIKWTLKGTGELLWGIKDGHFRSFDLEGDVALRYHLTWRYVWDVPECTEVAHARREDEVTGERREDWEGILRMQAGVGALTEHKK